MSYANSNLLFGEEKIELIDKKLSRLNRLVESLITDSPTRSMGTSVNNQDNSNSLSISHDMLSRGTPVGSPTEEGLTINAIVQQSSLFGFYLLANLCGPRTTYIFAGETNPSLGTLPIPLHPRLAMALHNSWDAKGESNRWQLLSAHAQYPETRSGCTALVFVPVATIQASTSSKPSIRQDDF